MENDDANRCRFYMLGLENAKNTNFRCTNTHIKREEDKDLRGLARCLRSRDRREKDLLICTRLQEDLQEILSKTHFSLMSQNIVTSSIYREEKKTPKTAQVGFRINSDPIARSTTRCSNLLQDLLERSVTSRSTDPMSFFFTI